MTSRVSPHSEGKVTRPHAVNESSVRECTEPRRAHPALVRPVHLVITSVESTWVRAARTDTTERSRRCCRSLILSTVKETRLGSPIDTRLVTGIDSVVGDRTRWMPSKHSSVI